MRSTTTLRNSFQTSRRAPRTSEVLVLIALALTAAWMAYAFAQEVMAGRHISQQAAALRQQNATLQAENNGYEQDIAAVASGAASEEEARQNGYARPGEKVYVVATPPPQPAAVAKPVVKVEAVKGDFADGVGRWLRDVLKR